MAALCFEGIHRSFRASGAAVNSEPASLSGPDAGSQNAGKAVLEALRTVSPCLLGRFHDRGAPAARRDTGNASPVASAIELDGLGDAR